jgi:RNA polymerase sigma-70 factor (ECF subfamily)
MNHNVQFPLTPWTKLREAVGTSLGDERSAAINYLCSHYWYPLYAFARWKGWNHEDAQDQTQIFLSRLIERNSLEHADENKGRLRTYLLNAFQNQWSHHRERQRTARRGGGGDMLSLQMPGAEERFARELCDPALNPEDHYDRAWALAVVDACLTDLEADLARQGQAEAFAVLRPFLSPLSIADVSVSEAGKRLGLNDQAVRQRIFRLRAAFSKALRAHIAGSLADPTKEAVDEEMRSLRRALERL